VGTGDERARFVNREAEPGYAGLGTFCKSALALRPEELEGADVAILGAPLDEGVANRPGARFGPRAIRLADNIPWSPPHRPNLALGIDPFEHLRVVDYGDAECVPASLEASHRQVRERLDEVLAAGCMPVVLGGDHSVAHPVIAALAEHHGQGKLGVIQFDAHADTGDAPFDVALGHGTPMRVAVESGAVRGEHFLQYGLRGYWPDPPEWDWMREVGMRWMTMDDVVERGFGASVETLIATAATDLPDAIHLVIDIDVLDPAFAPGTGTPEPGGLSARELLYAVRQICSRLPVRSLEVVEVSPPYDPSGITALAAHRCVLEALSGIALRRVGREARPQRPGIPFHDAAGA